MPPGKKLASANPRMNRMTWKETPPVTNSMQDETMPQVTMMRVPQMRAPNL